MSAYNKVVWSEGLFLQPHHLQQQDRYLEQYVEQRCRSLVPFSWGFSEVELERDLLSIGKLGLRRAVGVFPDGTPIRMPDDDPVPEPLSVSEDVRDQVVYLSVPVRRIGAQDVDRATGSEALARHTVREWEARDVTGASGTTATVEVGALRSRLLLASDTTEAYACIPVAHITECRPDKQVVLEDRFIPTVLRSGAAIRLATFTTELLGLLHQRGEELGGRAIASSRGSSDEFVSYLFLQAVNRYEPLLAHLDESGALHPETLYRLLVMAAGELATFSATSKRAPTLPPYRHHQLRESFEPVMAALRFALSTQTPHSAIPIPLETRKYGVRLGVAPDRNLYDTAVFVLAARADVPAEDLRRRFPGQLKIGPLEQIQNLVNLALPGVPVTPMPTAPRQLPFHAGFVYFELDQTAKLWALMKTSGGVALHVAGDFPGLTLEFWAIRE